MIAAVQRGDGSGGEALASHVLNTLGLSLEPESAGFQALSVEMLKLMITVRTIVAARSNGDYSTEGDLLNGWRALPADSLIDKPVAISSGPALSDAWREYFAEKTAAHPRPAWRGKTARGQAAMFAELLEIMGDLPVAEVTRNHMLKYRDSIARLPANRQKRYPGKTANELLALEIPASKRPSGRTVMEKIIQTAAFWSWCRTTKGYLQTDPTAGVKVDLASQSYSAFTKSDLQSLFFSDAYVGARHRSSWQYWIPLVALYTGARQTEIAQMHVRDVAQEDGCWFLTITDAGEDQRVKSRAGVRKVPVSSRLAHVGFLDYVAELRVRGESRLFPDLRRGPYGWGHYVSRWFNETYKKNCGLVSDATGRRKVFHSFRHTAITQALGRGIPFAQAQQVFGHEKTLLGETATYMSQFPIETLVPVIESLDFGLDHSSYRESWRIYLKRLGRGPRGGTEPADSVSP